MREIEEKEAKRIVTAYAACSIVNGCNLCPLYDDERQRTTQRDICKEALSADKVRSALIMLRGNKD